MNKNENPIIVGLDIGTTKVVAIAGRKNDFGKIEIIGFGRAESNGVSHGVVLNLDQCITSIKKSIDNLHENNPNLDIHNVYVGIAGQHIKSIPSRGDRVRTSSEQIITKEEIEMLMSDQRKTHIPAGDEVIDIIPTEFSVDNITNIPERSVIGMNGTKFGANFHIITGDKTAIKNIQRCVESADLYTKDLVLQPLASASAVLADDDLEAGVAIVDIGGGTTDMAVFVDGILQHTAVIPFAGTNITNDIKNGLGVLKAQAEQLKIQFGSAIAEEASGNQYISIPGLKGLPARNLSTKTLSNIIQARMEEILEYVVYHLKQHDLDKKLHGGIILTGGGSSLKHLKQLTEFKTGLNTRIGYPTEHLSGGYDEVLNNPMYSTCIGLILKGYLDLEKSNSTTHVIRQKNTELSAQPEAPVAPVPQDPVARQAASNIVSEEAFEAEDDLLQEPKEAKENPGIKVSQRVASIFGTLKNSIKELFSENEDQQLN